MRSKYFVQDVDLEPHVYWRITDNWLELSVRFLTLAHGVREVKDQMSREVLAALDEAMLQQLPEDRFCTVACVRLEPEDGSPGVGADVSRAGHPPPLIVRADGSVEEVGCSGRVLGVFPDAELRDTALRLMPGETLVLYTDGVTEARSPDGKFFGEGRLRDLLRSCAGFDAGAFAGSIKGVVLEFQEGSPRDDLAILVLRVRG